MTPVAADSHGIILWIPWVQMLSWPKNVAWRAARLRTILLSADTSLIELSMGFFRMVTSGHSALSILSSKGPDKQEIAHGLRNAINGEIAKAVEQARSKHGRNLGASMAVHLPREQYDQLTALRVGDQVLMDNIVEDNPWTCFTQGRPLTIHRTTDNGIRVIAA